ncbi:MAG: ATP-binding cassette domain-containing protein [Phycisphaerae bacterium]|nr:ATP-binding cassette domain-containing protein [Phycisphaerae bacterium]
MLVVPRVESEESAKRSLESTTFKHFRRLLRYAWPHKRYLLPAGVCILLMAVTYSASIGSMLPLLTVMLKPQGLHGWVDQYIAESRLRCELGYYEVLRHGKIDEVPAGAGLIRTIKSHSPLSGQLHEGDFILAVNGHTGDAVEVFRQLAGAEQEVSITYRTAQGTSGTAVVPIPPPRTMSDAAYAKALAVAKKAVGLIPGGRSPEERWLTLVYVLGVLLATALIGGTANVLAEYLVLIVNCRAIIDIRRQMYRHVLNLPLSHFSRSTADTMSKFLQDTQDIFRGLTNFFQKVVTEPFKAIGVTVVALLLDWQLTLALLLGAPLAVLLFRKLGKIIRKANRKLLAGYGRMLSRLESTLVGLRVVKAYTRENYERKRLFRVDRSMLKQELKMGLVEALTSPTIEFFAFLGASAVILYFATGVLHQPDKLADFMTMLVCMGAIFDPIRKLSSVYPKLQRANAAAQRIFELIDSRNEYEQDAGRPAIRPITESIRFENVSFAYPGSDRPAVCDFWLTVRKGETIAIVGPNGSGKTTLLSLLPRFFPLDRGRILIDGQDIAGVTLRSLRSQFSIITQESVIFPDTVAENIAYGRPAASRAEIEAAATQAFADEFVRQMPEGYETVLGEHGANLSGGQRQRIAIARAILRNAPILIFDEATGQVDPESEMKIHQALDVVLKNRTTFIIAHRFSTISGADRIVVMDRGQMVAAGPHAELMENCPLYRSLYESSFRESG